MSDTIEQATAYKVLETVIGDVFGDCPEGVSASTLASNCHRALSVAGLLAESVEGELADSTVQEWVMIPADQVHDEWAVERPDPVDHQPRYDRFPTLDAALSERWGNDRAVHRVATGWEPVDPEEVDGDG